jgi:hypothetical protein
MKAFVPRLSALAVIAIGTDARARPTGPRLSCAHSDDTPACRGAIVACTQCHTAPPELNACGVDLVTGLTFGFNRRTGVAEPGTLLHEGDVYNIVAQALDIDFAGRLDAPAVVR